MVIKNAGYQVTTYAGEPHQKLPFEIQAGISQRLAYAPFRFSLTLNISKSLTLLINIRNLL